MKAQQVGGVETPTTLKWTSRRTWIASYPFNHPTKKKEMEKFMFAFLIDLGEE